MEEPQEAERGHGKLENTREDHGRLEEIMGDWESTGKMTLSLGKVARTEPGRLGEGRKDAWRLGRYHRGLGIGLREWAKSSEQWRP